MTPLELEIGKFVRRVESNGASVCWCSICKAEVFFKLDAGSINSAGIVCRNLLRVIVCELSSLLELLKEDAKRL